MSDVQFTCKKCGSHRLEEIMGNVTVASKIVSVGEGGDIEYGEQSNDGGYVDRYQCMDCGLAIPDVFNCDDLYEYLAGEDDGDDPYSEIEYMELRKVLREKEAIFAALGGPHAQMAEVYQAELDAIRRSLARRDRVGDE